MAKQTRIIVIVLGIVLILFFINQRSQKRYTVQNDTIVINERDDIHRFVVKKEGQEIELVRSDTSWVISEHDSLLVKAPNLDSFFDDVLQLKKELNPISNNPENWTKYSVDDSTGTHLYIYGSNDDELIHVILGRTKTNYGKNSIRVNNDPNVYLTNKNILFRLQTRPTYWGETPKSKKLEQDTLNAQPPTIPFNLPQIPPDTVQNQVYYK